MGVCVCVGCGERGRDNGGSIGSVRLLSYAVVNGVLVCLSSIELKFMVYKLIRNQYVYFVVVVNCFMVWHDLTKHK